MTTENSNFKDIITICKKWVERNDNYQYGFTIFISIMKRIENNTKTNPNNLAKENLSDLVRLERSYKRTIEDLKTLTNNKETKQHLKVINEMALTIATIRKLLIECMTTVEYTQSLNTASGRLTFSSTRSLPPQETPAIRPNRPMR